MVGPRAFALRQPKRRHALLGGTVGMNEHRLRVFFSVVFCTPFPQPRTRDRGTRHTTPDSSVRLPQTRPPDPEALDTPPVEYTVVIVRYYLC